MKVFISKFLFFITPVVIIFIITEVLLRNIPNDYSLKSKVLKNEGNNIEVLFLGSSHAYYGVNPEFIDDYKSFNASYISQSIDLDYAILKKYEDNLNNLKVVVMPIDYSSLYGRLETSVEHWRIKNYNIYYNIHNSLSLKDNSEVLSNSSDIIINKVKNYYFSNKNYITSNKFGYGQIKKKIKT